MLGTSLAPGYVILFLALSVLKPGYIGGILTFSFVVNIGCGFWYCDLVALFLCRNLGRNKSYAAFIMAIFILVLTI